MVIIRSATMGWPRSVCRICVGTCEPGRTSERAQIICYEREASAIRGAYSFIAFK